MKTKRILAVIAAFTIVFGSVPTQPFADVIGNLSITANAEDDVITGSCGAYNEASETTDNVKYSLDKVTGKLTISGTGAIADGAFLDYSNDIKTVEIQTGVIAIRNCAFGTCKSLVSVKISDTVKTIEQYAFFDCSSLQSVLFGENPECESIGKSAFSQCSSLSNIIIPDSVSSIGEEAFSGCSSLTSVEIPNSVTSIGNLAFSECQNLSINTIPDSVTSIGGAAFAGCSSLRSITVSNAVTKIDGHFFADCSSLRSITIPDSVTSIGNGAFYECNNLKNVYYTGSKEDWDKIIIDTNNSCLSDATITYNYKGVKGASLALDGTLKVNIAFGEEVDISNWTINGKSFTLTNGIATYEVPAKDFNGEIAIKNGEETVASFSVADMIKSYKKSESTKQVATALEEYCASAKAYFDDGVYLLMIIQHNGIL